MIALGRSRNELDAVVGPAASARRLTVLPRGRTAAPRNASRKSRRDDGDRLTSTRDLR